MLTTRVRQALSSHMLEGPVRSVLTLVGGTAFAQFFMVVASPLLSRLYSPTEMGVYSVYSSILAVVAVVATLRYELAIPLPESDREASAVAVLSYGAALLIVTVTIIAALLWGESIAFLLGIPPRYSHYLLLVPIGVAVASLYQIANYWAIRSKAFGILAQTKWVQVVARLVVQLTGAAFGPAALVFGHILGQGMGIARLTRDALRNGGLTPRLVSATEVGNAARRYARFPLYSTWSALFNTCGVQLPPMLFSALFSPAVAGIYSLTHRVLAMPVSLVGQAVAQVFLAHAPQAYREGHLGSLVAKTHSRLAMVAMPPMLLVVLVGPKLFGVVFGEEWVEAGILARWMAPWIYFVFVTSPLSTIFSVLEKQAQGMMLQGILVVVRVVTLIVGARLGSVEFAVALFSLGSAACWIGFLVWMGRAIRSSLWDVVVLPTSRALAYATACLMPIILVLVIWGIDAVSVWPALVISAMLTIAMLVRTVGRGLLASDERS